MKWKHALNTLIALGVTVCVMLIVVIVLGTAYPTAADRLSARILADRSDFARAMGYVDDAIAAVIGRAREGWAYRVAGPFARYVTPGDAGVDEVNEAVVDPGFDEESCLECHPDYVERPRFSIVYFQHEQHATAETPCERCHSDSGPHPHRDSVPVMDGCGECHEQTAPGGECAMCHPTGSLFHGAEISGDRDLSEQCDTCHIPESLVTPNMPREMPSFAADSDTCSRCHEETAFCASCHPSTHGPGYDVRHAMDLSERPSGVRECWGCHAAHWCAEACHAQTEGSR